jgi:glycosyltransferase involved in cell wall biosynthesis
MRLSVVVPCFNEGGNIARVVVQAAEVGRQHALELEIIVVDDGSRDDTAQVLSSLKQVVPELQTVTHPHNRGYGAAVRSGFDRARMDYVFLTDGDGQFDLEELPVAIRLLNDHDLVVGYRAQRRDGWWRRFCGRSWTVLLNWVLSLRVRDANCAFKLLPQSLLCSGDFRSEGALISAELVAAARRLELRIGECAVSHYPRRIGRQSGASIRVIATAFIELAGCLARRWRSRAPAVGQTT